MISVLPPAQAVQVMDKKREQTEQTLEHEKRETISVHEVAGIVSDEVAAAFITRKASDRGHTHSRGKVATRRVRAIVNIDRISSTFEEGEVVNLSTLKLKKLHVSSVSYYKVLARGFLNKTLVIEANEFSLDAAKMILLTGGKAIIN